MKRLALVYPKAIGDFLFVLPALHTIRRAWPEARITLVVKRKQAPLALPQKGLLADEVLVLGGGMGWRGIRRALADQQVDTVVDLAGNDQSGLILAWRGGRRVRPTRRLQGPLRLVFPLRGIHAPPARRPAPRG
jgi:ADP-heptose:LPS heptosyltransferase